MFKNIVFLFVSFSVIMSCDIASQKSASSSPIEKGKIFMADADKTRKEGDDRAAKKIYKNAIIEFETAAKEDSNQPDLASLLGQSQYRIRDFDNAIQWLNKAVASDKEDAKSQQYLGYCLVNKTKIKEADEAFKKAFLIDKLGSVKKETILELTEIGELSLSIGSNFTSQGNQAQGVEFKKLGIRILAMALEYSKYDLTLAKQIQIYANDMQDQILMDWIANVIDNEKNKTTTITIEK